LKEKEMSTIGDTKSLGGPITPAEQMKMDMERNAKATQMGYTSGAIKNFMHTGSGFGDKTFIQELMSKFGPDKRSNSALKNIAENAKQSFDTLRDVTAKNFEKLNALIPIGRGYSIDTTSGKIVFDVSEFFKEMNNNPSPNMFIESLKSKTNNNVLSSPRKSISNDSDNSRTETLTMDLAVKKQQADTLLNKIMKDASMFTRAHKQMDTGTVMSLLC